MENRIAIMESNEPPGKPIPEENEIDIDDVDEFEAKMEDEVNSKLNK
jgi:hypothetical protein